MRSLPFENGICYSGYRRGQSPRTGLCPEESQVAEDLEILVARGYRLLRMYEPGKHTEMVLKRIRQDGLPLQVQVGIDPRAELYNPRCAWAKKLSEEEAKANRSYNEAQLARLCVLAGEYEREIVALSVGNENTPDWGGDILAQERLVEFALRVRESCRQPVTYNEGAPQWKELRALGEILDFISIHSYPQWNRVPLKEAAAWTRRDYEEVKALYPDKQIVIGEYGWTTKSDSCQMLQDEASAAGQALYLGQMEQWLKREQATAFVFEAFDEPWKGGGQEAEPEKHWGLCTEERREKNPALSPAGGYVFLDDAGTFRLRSPERVSGLYLPLTAPGGLKSCISPLLGGDAKIDQEHFLLQPVSIDDLHINRSSRNFWCSTGDGRIWSAAGVSPEQIQGRFCPQEEVTLEAGPLWQCVRRSRSGFLTASVTSWVPDEAPRTEVMWVSVRNESKEELTLTATAAVPIYGRSADNLRDHRHVTSLLHRTYTSQRAVIVRPALSFDEKGHRKNDTAYFVAGAGECGEMPQEFCPDAAAFIGEGGSFEWPEWVVRGLPGCPPGSRLCGKESVGALRFAPRRLRPGETADYIVVMGILEGQEIESRKEEEYLDKLGSRTKASRSLEKTKKSWQDRQTISFATSDRQRDRLYRWICLQPDLRRIFGCSFLPHHDYGRGGRGWRDLWQDCLAGLITEPALLRDSLIAYFGGVRMDGTNATIIGTTPGEFIADRNQILRVWMDHGYWPFVTLEFYVQQTGDLDVLFEAVPYFQDGQIKRGTEKDPQCEEADHRLRTVSGEPYLGTVLEHVLIEHLTACAELGEHGYIRLRGADWNDALDMASDRGESVAFTAAYAGGLTKLARLLRHIGEVRPQQKLMLAQELGELTSMSKKSDEEKRESLARYAEACRGRISGRRAGFDALELAAELEALASGMKERIRSREWVQSEPDCGFMNGYYDNLGRAVEGAGPEGVRMMLTSQVFALASDTATESQAAMMVKSADRYLYHRERGGYCLNTEFGEGELTLGRMFGFAYGHKENGAVFSHMAVMYAHALYGRKMVREGYRVIDNLLRQAADFSVSRIYPGIPEYFDRNGRGMYHYLTGAASWLMLTAVTEMFGVKGKWGDMIFEPKLMAEQFDAKGQAMIRLRFAGRSFQVTYHNPLRLEYGVYKIGRMTVGGREWPENILRKAELESFAACQEQQIDIWLEEKKSKERGKTK